MRRAFAGSAASDAGAEAVAHLPATFEITKNGAHVQASSHSAGLDFLGVVENKKLAARLRAGLRG